MIRIISILLLASCLGCSSNTSKQVTGSLPESLACLEPDFIRDYYPTIKWESEFVDTMFHSTKETIWITCDMYFRTCILYDKDQIIFDDPTLEVDSFNVLVPSKFWVKTAYAQKLVDLSDKNSVNQIVQWNKSRMNGYHRFQKDYTFSIGGNITLYHINVDYPHDSIRSSSKIQAWIVNQINQLIAPNKNVAHRKSKGYLNINHVAKLAADNYYRQQLKEYPDTDYCPSSLSSVVDLRIKEANDRTISYQQYTHSYDGGAHGYSTEKIISFDWVHNKNITNEYLFRKECLNEVKRLLLKAARKDSKFAYWENIKSIDDVKRKFMSLDENGNLIDSMDQMFLPKPGLTENGLLFSFQPYDLSCFAAGCFHFLISYSEVRPYLSQEGKWCIGNQ